MQTQDHAVVLGGSIAGLLAARVLADVYPEVTVRGPRPARARRRPAARRAAGPAHPRPARPRSVGAGGAVPRA